MSLIKSILKHYKITNVLQITSEFDFCCANVFVILYNKRSHAQQLSNNNMFLGMLFLFTLK